MNGNAPRVSVIIPAFHSESTIGGCLEAITGQTFQDLEVIVVNSSNEDRTRQIVLSHYPRAIFDQSPVRLLPHAARNRGVAQARGEMLAFTDPDCIPRPEWLAHLVQACEDGHSVVSGSMDLKDENWWASGIHLCKWFWLLSGLRPHSPKIVATGNAAYSRQVWEAVGPFDGDLYNGDALFSWRASARGFSLWFEPGAIVEQIHRENWVEFVRERYSRGREFGQVRAQFEQWSRSRALAYSLGIPLLLIVILARTERAARSANMSRDFWLTIPVSILGQLAWLLGESRAELEYSHRHRAADSAKR